MAARLAAAAMAMSMGRMALFRRLDLFRRQVGQVVRHHADLHLDDAFDVAQISALRRIAEADGDAFTTGAGRAANTVDVRFRLVRQLEIDHMADMVDVDPAGGDIGCHQHARLAGLEHFERPLAGILRLVAVNSFRRDAGLGQVLGDAVGAMLGAGEDDDAVERDIFQQIAEKLALLRHRHVVKALHDAVSGLALRRDFDPFRILQHIAHQLDDVVRHGGGEQHRLPFPGQIVHDLADIADEAHVEHAVGFVDDQHLHRVEADHLLLHQVE